MDKKGGKKRQVRAKRRKGRMDEDGQWALRTIVRSILKDMTFIHIQTKSSELWQVTPAKRYKHTTYCSKNRYNCWCGIALCCSHFSHKNTHLNKFIHPRAECCCFHVLDGLTNAVTILCCSYGNGWTGPRCTTIGGKVIIVDDRDWAISQTI